MPTLRSARDHARVARFPAVQSCRPERQQQAGHERRGAPGHVERGENRRLPGPHRERPEDDLGDRQAADEDGRADQAAVATMPAQRPYHGPSHQEDHQQGPHAMREVDRHMGVGHRRDQPAERQWKIRDREARVGVAHHRAEEDLDVDRQRRGAGQSRQVRAH